MELGRMPHNNLHVVERELPMADILAMNRGPQNFLTINKTFLTGVETCLRCLQRGLRPPLCRSANFCFQRLHQVLQVGGLLYKGEMVQMPTPAEVACF